LPSLQVLLAEHLIHFHSNSDSVMAYLEGSMGPLIRNELRLEPDLLVDVIDGYGIAFTDFNVSVVSQGTNIIHKRTDYRIEAASDFRTARIEVHDEFALKHALINLYSCFITHREWGLLIHSSCLVDNERAYLFAGHSGAGKSTVARLSVPRLILSDEATVVKIKKGEPLAYNSPFRSDTVMPSSGQMYPLEAIQLLRQSSQNKRIPMGKFDGIVRLVNRVFYWPHDPEDTKKVFRLCHTLADEVPIYEMYFQKNNSFWEEITG
jgi:hypothetical protein